MKKIKKTAKHTRHLTRRETESMQKKLLSTRENLLKLVTKKRSLELSEPDVGDGADHASQSLEKEMLFELSDTERATLDQIEAALRRIEKKTYGICESCHKPIAKERIKVLPAARYCISCQNVSETAG